MADRNTVIYGNQIKDGTVTEDELNASVAGGGLAGGAGSPLSVNVDDSTTEISGDAVIVKDDGITNAKLANITRGSVKVGGVADAPSDLVALTNAQILIGDGTDVVSVAVSGDVGIINDGTTTIQALVVDNGKIANDTILEAKLDATNAPTDGYFLVFDNASGGFTWVESPATSGVQEADLAVDDFSATTNGILTDFDLTDVAVTASLQVFINGILAQEGASNDYELNPDSGDTKTIRVNGDVLATGEKLIVHYIKDN